MCYYSDDLYGELKRLRAMNLVHHYEGTGLAALRREFKDRTVQFDLRRHFYITEQGREYLEFAPAARDGGVRRFMSRTLVHAVGFLTCFAAVAFPCTRTSPVSPEELVRDADAIVRARAVEYAKPPANPGIVRTGEPDSRVRFSILEVVRGTDLSAELVLPGYLSDRDDYNDHPPPYKFVRRGGRSGSCFANTYRAGAQFLLFLKRRPGGDLTVNWYGLGPVNEQLRSETDRWLLWVRQQVHDRTQFRHDPELGESKRT